MTQDLSTTPRGSFPTSGKLILAASTGGHLAQLYRLKSSLGADKDSLWITFDTEQSRSLLAGERVIYIPYIAPRDWRAVLAGRKKIARAIGDERFDGVVSTGASIAVAAFSSTPARGIPHLYIESVARVEGPSLTGRIVQRLRMAELRTQHPAWADDSWTYKGSVLSQFETVERDSETREVRIFVTLGTIRPYRFDRLVDAVLETGLTNESTVWQLGTTDRDDLPGTVQSSMNAEDFERHALAADVVVTHAGMGTILQLLDMGKSPVVVPRSKDQGEHVDDHQEQICRLLSRERLGVVAKSSELSSDHLNSAASRGTIARPRSPGAV